jgi:outer membrane protein TolC
MKKNLRCTAVSVSPLLLAGFAALALMPGCVQDPAPFDPRAARAWELNGDSSVKSAPEYPLPTTARTPYIPGVTEQTPENQYLMHLNVLKGPGVKLTLQQVVHRAMLNNEEVRVASYDTAVDQTRILEAEANFDPTVFMDASFQRIDKQTPGSEAAELSANANPNTNNAAHAFPTDIIERVSEQALSLSDFGIKQNLPAGGQIELKEQIASTWTNPPSGLLLQLTQPLLQNFGISVNRARITIAQNNSRISLLDFRNTVEKTVLTIEQTYWQLVQAQRDAVATRELLRSYGILRDKLYHRLHQGADVTESQVEQVNAETSNREAQLIQLEYRIATLSVSLKQLMNDPSFPVSGNVIVEAVDDGTETPLHFNPDDQIETAMNNRYELGQQQVRVDSAEIAVDVARNNMLPTLNAVLSADVDGLARDINGAFNQEGEFNHLGYQAQLQFSFPLGDRAANAIWQRSLLQRMQAIHSYVGLVNQIATDVRTALYNVAQAWQVLSHQRDSRLHYQNTLAYQEKLNEKGDQPFTFDSLFVELQIRQQLLAAELAEDQALDDYNYAIASLEKAKGTILRYDNVMMEQEQLPFAMNVKGNPVPRELWMGTLHPQPEAPIMPTLPEIKGPVYDNPAVPSTPSAPATPSTEP